MSQPTATVAWPADPLGVLVLLLVVMYLALDFGRSANERLTVAIGAMAPTAIFDIDITYSTLIGCTWQTGTTASWN